MNIDMVKKMIHDCTSQNQVPKTILLTPEDAKKLGLPSWCRQFLGMKVVIGHNLTESKVVPHFYETVTLKKNTNTQDLEYQLRPSEK